MKITFYKYHGTGNDFIMIEDRDKSIEKKLSADIISLWCHRRFGVGADGLILLQADDTADFFMRYFNADGHISTMCGNGGRCISQFAFDRKWVTERTFEFMATDGLHHAEILDAGVKLGMQNVDKIEMDGQAFVMDTGSPHYVEFVEDIDNVDINQRGREVRFSDRYNKEGINVNVASLSDGECRMLTYERGVENETYSCGTGTVAVAIATARQSLPDGQHLIDINAKGGKLQVSLNQQDGTCTDIQLIGPAAFVFEGELSV